MKQRIEKLELGLNKAIDYLITFQEERCLNSFTDKITYLVDIVNMSENHKETISLSDIIKQIREIIGNFDSSVLKIGIWSDNEVTFYIYESEVPITVDGKKNEAYIDCETLSNHRLTGDMIMELGKITKLLEENIELILNSVRIN